jgi:hypothetical protein
MAPVSPWLRTEQIMAVALMCIGYHAKPVSIGEAISPIC